jgi:hypothetical protein
VLIERYNVEVEYFHNYFGSEDDAAMLVPNGPGYIKTPADAELRPLTQAEAEAVFAAMAAKGDKIPFGYLREGCEVRSQLMIEEMVAMGIDPGRAWAMVAPGKAMSVPNPVNPRQPHRWLNHTAPTVALDGTRQGIRVIDPSVPGVKGPLTIDAWAAAIKLTPFEMPARPLTQAEMLSIFAERTAKGQDLKGFVLVVERGVSPVADVPGSGFRIAADPPQGVSAFVQSETQRLFLEEAKLRPGGQP